MYVGVCARESVGECAMLRGSVVYIICADTSNDTAENWDYEGMAYVLSNAFCGVSICRNGTRYLSSILGCSTILYLCPPYAAAWPQGVAIIDIDIYGGAAFVA